MSQDKNLEWKQKINALPRIPRGNTGYPSALVSILEQIKQHKSDDLPVSLKGSNSARTIGQCCVALRPLRLVSKLADHQWILTKDAEHLLKENDPQKWFNSFANRLKYFGEMLNELRTPHSIRELVTIANDKYHLDWHSKDQTISRINWFQDWKLIESTGKDLYIITSRGEEYLDGIELIGPEYTSPEDDSTLNQQFDGFPSAIKKIVDEHDLTTNERRSGINYFLGGNEALLNSVVTVLTNIEDSQSVTLVSNFIQQTYNAKKSSATGFISLLANLKLIRYLRPGVVGINDAGKALVENPSWINLAAIFHSNYRFFFEILPEILNTPKSYKELSEIGKYSFHLDSQSVEPIRKRCTILLQAHLIRLVGKKVKATHLGEMILPYVKLSSPAQPQAKTSETQQDASTLINIITELSDASRDSVHATRFEKILAIAFERLGFTSKWIGGSGNTDVIVSTQTAAQYSYQFNVDAKATYSGPVNESLINFDTLEQHRKKHHSKYIIVVGAEFSSNRLIDWAIKHKVGLLETKTLVEMMVNHEKLPLTSAQYQNIFSQTGLITAEPLILPRQETHINAMLMSKLIFTLIKESQDSFTGGVLSSKDLYFLLRDDLQDDLKSLDRNDLVLQIENALDFLASPFMGIIGKGKNGYFATGSQIDASQKFQYYANQIADQV